MTCWFLSIAQGLDGNGRLTKSVVATSGAVVYFGGPELGWRTLSYQDCSIIHLEAEHFIRIAFVDLAHRNALLGPYNVHGKLLKFNNIECTVASAQLFLFPIKPSSGSVVKVIMEFIMLHGCYDALLVRCMSTEGS